MADPVMKAAFVIRDPSGGIERETTVNMDLVAKAEQHAKGQVKLTMQSAWWLIVHGEVWEFTGEAPPAKRKRGWSAAKVQA